MEMRSCGNCFNKIWTKDGSIYACKTSGESVCSSEEYETVYHATGSCNARNGSYSKKYKQTRTRSVNWKTVTDCAGYFDEVMQYTNKIRNAYNLLELNLVGLEIAKEFSVYPKDARVRLTLRQEYAVRLTVIKARTKVYTAADDDSETSYYISKYSHNILEAIQNKTPHYVPVNLAAASRMNVGAEVRASVNYCLMKRDKTDERSEEV